MLPMDQINRINELAHKSRTQGLTEEEKLEQQKLRCAYLRSLRTNVSAMLDNIVVEQPDGTQTPLPKKKLR